ncbi:MAG: hypothetical protein ACYTGN_01690 [Planctomycetota bacterium]
MRIFLACLIALAMAPEAPAQGSKLRLDHLRREQKDIANQLKSRVDQMKELIEDLRRRGETRKADLLAEAIAIVDSKEISLDNQSGSGQLADLRAAVLQMARTLEDRPNATDEVQDLAQQVVKVLDKVVATLLDKDDLASLEEREKAISDIREKAKQLARRQAELKRQTRAAVPRSEAEKTAQAASKELKRLEQELQKLDDQARRALSGLEKAREWASALRELSERQQRIQSDTKVRAGAADKITPRVNRAMTELEAIAKAADDAAKREGDKADLAELARDTRALAQRQAELADDVAKRARLEQMRESLSADRAPNEKAQIGKAAEQSEGKLADALRKAAANPEDKATLEQARKAVDEALKGVRSRPTLAMDQQALRREIDRAVMQAPEASEGPSKAATKALNDARRRAGDAAKALEQGTDAEAATKDAADKLKEAADAFQKASATETDKRRDAAQQQQLERAAKRAAKLAQDLKELADEKATQDAGLMGLAKQAEAAAKAAGKELERAAKAGQQGESKQAQDQAEAARDRAERARKELADGVRERQDLAQRQGKLADDLKAMVGRAARKGEQDEKAVRKAMDAAAQAQDALKKAQFKDAAGPQKEVVDALKEMAQRADQAVKKAAQDQQAALKQMQQRTQQAADKAGKLSQQLKQGAQQAREKDARRRMESAAQKTEKAAEALRRSLRRLKDLMPKPAEQERRAAKDQIADAQRDLKGVRETPKGASDASRDAMKKISKRQERLEQDVKSLEERLKRLKEKQGQERLQDAQSAMRDAQRQLQQGESSEAERSQDRAEKSLKEAEKDLAREERRYRNLRQYELLFKLKEELQEFRRMSQAHRESLQGIDAKVRAAGRVTRFINRKELKPLRNQIKGLAREVTEKSDAIEKERAIVYTYILRGCASDLSEVEGQLSVKEVGLVPQEMMGDVVRRFDLAIKGLERDLRERQDEQQKQQGQQGDKKDQQQNQGGGQPRLVPADAEVRMVLVLQKALNKEREDFFLNRPEFGARSPSEGEKARLERLYHQQGSLAELFDSVRQSLVGAPEDHPVPGQPEGEGEGAEEEDGE